MSSRCYLSRLKGHEYDAESHEHDSDYYSQFRVAHNFLFRIVYHHDHHKTSRKNAWEWRRGIPRIIRGAG